MKEKPKESDRDSIRTEDIEKEYRKLMIPAAATAAMGESYCHHIPLTSFIRNVISASLKIMLFICCIYTRFQKSDVTKFVMT